MRVLKQSKSKKFIDTFYPDKPVEDKTIENNKKRNKLYKNFNERVR